MKNNPYESILDVKYSEDDSYMQDHRFERMYGSQVVNRASKSLERNKEKYEVEVC